MPAAVAVPLILGAGSAATSLIGAKMQSGAAKSAAQTQAASVDKAQQFAQQAFQQQQAALSPYRQAGQAALASLMARQYGGSPAAYMPPQGYGVPPQMRMPQGVGLGTLGATAPNPGMANLNPAAIAARNIPPGVIGGLPQPPVSSDVMAMARARGVY